MLCDGQHSAAQIALQLHTMLNVPWSEELVALTRTELERCQLLEAQGEPLPEATTLTRRQLLRLGIVAALLPAVHSMVAPAPIEAQSPVPTPVPLNPRIFYYTRAEQTFVVPPGVTAITIEALGAQGGPNPDIIPPRAALGGRTVASLAVVPGETLFVYVGGSGTGNVTGAGGWNGGGPGGAGNTLHGFGGGGASDVRRGGNSLADRILVAGGAGGLAGSNDGGSGGAGGGLVGQSGQPGYVAAGPQLGSAGGAGGSGYPGEDGAPGSLGAGGAGGSYAPANGPDLLTGGGGGGGYYGGGGGEAGYLTSGLVPVSGGGGGGGSSFASPTASGVVYEQGVQRGHGLVIKGAPLASCLLPPASD
jgi:hypothetical protein